MVLVKVDNLVVNVDVDVVVVEELVLVDFVVEVEIIVA